MNIIFCSLRGQKVSTFAVAKFAVQKHDLCIFARNVTAVKNCGSICVCKWPRTNIFCNNISFESFGVEVLWLKRPGLKCPATISGQSLRVEMFIVGNLMVEAWGWKGLNHGLFNPRTQVEMFMVENPGVEKSGVEAVGLKFRAWNVLQPFEWSFHSSTLLHSNSQSSAGHFVWKAFTALDVMIFPSLSGLQSKSKKVKLMKNLYNYKKYLHI